MTKFLWNTSLNKGGNRQRRWGYLFKIVSIKKSPSQLGLTAPLLRGLVLTLFLSLTSPLFAGDLLSGFYGTLGGTKANATLVGTDNTYSTTGAQVSLGYNIDTYFGMVLAYTYVGEEKYFVGNNEIKQEETLTDLRATLTFPLTEAITLSGNFGTAYRTANVSDTSYQEWEGVYGGVVSVQLGDANSPALYFSASRYLAKSDDPLASLTLYSAGIKLFF
jgi:hypothetical protein